MSSRTLPLIGISLVMGLGAAWMADSWLSARLNATPDDHLRSVVVATVEIPFGQMVEAQQVTTVRMPMDTIPDDAFDSSEQAVGKIATFDILRGDIVRGARLSEHLGGSTLASLIAPDKRAISVRVDDVVRCRRVPAAGQPGRRVGDQDHQRRQQQRDVPDPPGKPAGAGGRPDRRHGQDPTGSGAGRDAGNVGHRSGIAGHRADRRQAAIGLAQSVEPGEKAVAVAPPAPAPVMAMAAAPMPKPVMQRSAKPQGGAITLIRGVESSVINVR